jgi:hypothetical protein
LLQAVLNSEQSLIMRFFIGTTYSGVLILDDRLCAVLQLFCVTQSKRREVARMTIKGRFHFSILIDLLVDFVIGMRYLAHMDLHHRMEKNRKIDP